MKIKIRKGLFETNSSSEHTVTISIGDFYNQSFEVDEYDDGYFEIDEDEVLDNISIDKLNEAVRRRMEKYRCQISDVPTDILEEEIKKRKKR